MTEKPRHRSGYSPEETEVVRSAALTVIVTLGGYLESLVIVGGLVPSLLIAMPHDGDVDADPHPGTNDLDLGLSLALLDEQRYAEISERLRAEGFEPDVNESGNQTVQRWQRGGLTVDFLIPPADDGAPDRRVHNLEPDFGAIVTRGLELAFDEISWIEIDGTTLSGERAKREVPVCGPAAFVVLKALAFGDRSEPKDAFDLVYVLEYAPGGTEALAARLQEHAVKHPEVVDEAVGLLERDFESVEHIGPLRAAEFQGPEGSESAELAADAHGLVDDLLRAFRKE